MAGEVNIMTKLSSLAYEIPKSIEQRRVAAEETLGLLRNDIGKAGTYDLPGTSAPSAGPSSSEEPAVPTEDSRLSRGLLRFNSQKDVHKYDQLIKKGFTAEEARRQLGGHVQTSTVGTTGIFTNKSNEAAPGGLGSKYGTVGGHIELDPEAAKTSLEQSSAFRQVSRMMAESEQLLARSGPLYDDMIRSTQLPIIEGAAAAARENTEAIRKAMARGGAARRDGFAAIQKIRAQDQLNMQRGQALADAHLKLDMWSRDNAKNVINFADEWSANQAGVRDSFNTAMDRAAELMSSQALPFMYTTQVKAQEYRDINSAASRSKVNNWIKGTLGLVVGAVGAYSGGSGEAMNMFGDMSGKAAAAEQSAASSERGYTGGSMPTYADATSNNYMGAGGQ